MTRGPGLPGGYVRYFRTAMAASALALAVVMSPALHAASASLISVEALLMPSPAGLAPASDRGA